MRQRYVSFAGQSLALEYSREFSGMVDFLYEDTDSVSTGAPAVKFRLHRVDGKMTLLKGSKYLYQGNDEAALATILIRETIRSLIDQNADGLALHAAALSRNGKGILLPGRSGCGKTSLSTWLASRGFNYLTDEYVFIGNNTNTIQAFARPPNVKVRGIEEALQRFFDMNKHEGQTLKGKQVAMIPTRLLNPGNKRECPSVDLILFPDFKKNSSFRLEELSKAQLGLALMESLVNARNLVGHGLGEVTRLARTSTSYRLKYGAFDQLGEAFDRILP
ncbi:hypothetical protein ACFL1S_06800 [Pseudomonadota bacterium]